MSKAVAELKSSLQRPSLLMRLDLAGENERDPNAALLREAALHIRGADNNRECLVRDYHRHEALIKQLRDYIDKVTHERDLLTVELLRRDGKPVPIGEDEGELCMRDGCEGVLKWESSCRPGGGSAWLQCPECDWQSESFP